MIGLAATFLGLAAAAPSPPAARVAITKPVAIVLPASAAAAFEGCQGLPQKPPPGDRPLHLPQALPLPSRVDVLITSEGRWLLVESFTTDSRITLPTRLPHGHVAVMARPCHAPTNVYGWADVGQSGEVSLIMQKTVYLSSDAVGEAFLFVAGEESSRALDRRGLRQLEHVPLEASLLCVRGRSVETDQCALVASAASFPGPEALTGLRLFQAPVSARPTVRTAGRSVLRPREASPATLRAGAWLALSPPAAVSWSAATLIWKTGDRVLQTFPGKELLPLPEFATVSVGVASPLRLRPVIAGGAQVEKGAELVILAPGDDSVPLDVMAVAADGTATAALPSGHYKIKLLASLARPTPLVADLRGDFVNTLEFVPSQRIRGRVLPPPGGELPHPSFARTLPRAASAEGLSPGDPEQRGDLAESARESLLDQDGSFEIGIPGPGRYSLMIVAGSKHASRNVEIKGTDDFDLGTIVLSSGVTLRGSLAEPCTGGEVALTQLPAQTSGQTRFFDHRRIPLAPDGTFQAEGLDAGPWLASATYSDVPGRISLSPGPFDVSDSGEVLVLRFSRQPR